MTDEQDDDALNMQEEAALLEQYEERQRIKREEDNFLALAHCCSPRPQDFWRPEVGERFAFGSADVNGRWCTPVYIIEFAIAWEELFVTLIASRDPALPCREARVRIKFAALSGDGSENPKGLSGLPLQLWQVIQKHFGPHRPRRKLRQSA